MSGLAALTKIFLAEIERCLVAASGETLVPTCREPLISPEMVAKLPLPGLTSVRQPLTATALPVGGGPGGSSCHDTMTSLSFWSWQQ